MPVAQKPTPLEAAQRAAEQETRGLGINQAAREKYWSEITIEEKIERIRNLVKSNRNDLSRLEKDINSIKDHVHDEEGKAVIKVSLHEMYKFSAVLNQIGGSLLDRSAGKDDEVYI